MRHPRHRERVDEFFSPMVKHSLIGALLFFVIGSPLTYKVVGMIIPGVVTDLGVPTWLGLVIHSVVFALVFYAILFLWHKVIEPLEHFVTIGDEKKVGEWETPSPAF